jgi:hypothetical protein
VGSCDLGPGEYSVRFQARPMPPSARSSGVRQRVSAVLGGGGRTHMRSGYPAHAWSAVSVLVQKTASETGLMQRVAKIDPGVPLSPWFRTAEAPSSDAKQHYISAPRGAVRQTPLVRGQSSTAWPRTINGMQVVHALIALRKNPRCQHFPKAYCVTRSAF